jgi:uncharacterized delta-60 repeat protein
MSRAVLLATLIGAICGLVSLSPRLATASPVAAALPDGKTLVSVDRGSQIAIARLNSNGSIDRSYGVHGYAPTGIPRGLVATGIVARPDGGVDLAATKRCGLHCFFYNLIAQLTPDGHADSSFGANGVAEPFDKFGGNALYDVGNIALSADGRVLVAGTAYTQCSSGSGCRETPAVGRLTVDGSLDSTFGNHGLAVVDAYGSGDAIAVDATGRIIVGSAHSLYTPVVGRFDPAGGPDASFGSGTGYVNVAVPASAAEIGPDGRIYVGGSDGKTIGATRLEPDGSVDSSFADGGRFTTPAERLGAASTGFNGSLAMGANGDVLVAGIVGKDCVGGGNLVCRLREEIVRLGSDGAPDSKFGSNGIAQIPFSRYRVVLGRPTEPGFFVQGSGGSRLVMPTYLGPYRSPSEIFPVQVSSVAALGDDGMLVPSFGDGGVAELPFGWCPSHFCPRAHLTLSTDRSEAKRLALRVDQPRMQLTGVRLALPAGVSLNGAPVRATAGGEPVPTSAIRVSGRVVSVAADRHRVQSVRVRIGGLDVSSTAARHFVAKLRVKHVSGVEAYSGKVTATVADATAPGS